MKKQILTLIIGILIGAIITAAVFLLLKANTVEQGKRMNRGQMPSRDENFQGGENRFARPEGNLNTQIEESDLNSNNIQD